MDTIQSLAVRALGGSVIVYIVIEIIWLLIIILILYTVIKYAVKNAVIELRKEFNYTIRKALLESKADIDAGVEKIPDYRLPDYYEIYGMSKEMPVIRRGQAHEKMEWIPMKNDKKEQKK